MKRKKLCALGLAFSLMLTLCACWSEPENEDFWEPDLNEEPAPSLVESEISEFTLPYLSGQSLDPITCPDGIQRTVSTLLYEGLFELNPSFAPQKVLCNSYTYDAETFTYSFSLRSDALFPDGSALKPSDALSSYQRAQVSERYGARFDAVTSMHVSGEQLVIKLAYANSAFPALLDIPIVKAGSEKDPVPLGTGPYLFLTDSSGTCLLKNKDWWRGGALPLERIALVAAKDNDTAAYLFSAYEAHMLVSDLTGTAQYVVSKESDVTDCADTTMLYLGFNTLRAPFSAAPVRNAVSRSIDRSQITTALLAGHAKEAILPIHPDSALSSTVLPAITQEEYEAALQAAGFTAQRPHSISLLVNQENSFKVSIAEHLCRQLSCGALTLQIKELPWNEYLAALQSGNFDLFLGEVKLTADWNFSSLVGSAGALNYGKYADPQTDQMLSAFLANESTAAAEGLGRHFLAASPIAPLIFKEVSVSTPSGLVGNISPTAADPFYGFEHWEFSLK